MSYIVFGGRPRFGGGATVGLFSTNDATIILKINDIYLPMFNLFR
jgi:hypothetical protein